ncbi:LacI family DNA-binding transcriptional regulator [Roseateles asaccharophilus]|uniref:LacI family transcriptional regulator n=1 Tax=Roseateles asaccharophilus TaxID=582607 RepID=A0ABU2AAV4_9BURK|nr:LacI family DNA-binding transcriptional regulator [Roseateles asaccharophilus]MDR7334341.1 LacI family transcriptional regulator [Roseateles asaccharophilus]
MNQPLRQRRRTKLATIADVADMAGVSPMTVSRVVNGEANVRPETRDKVRAAVAALNYQAHPSSRRVENTDAISIGMVYHDPSVGYLNDFLIGLLNKASLRHVQLDVQRCETRDDEEAMVGTMLASGLDGLILAPPFCDAERLLEMVTNSATLAVAVSSGRPHERVSAVGIDDYRAAYDMTRHLLQLGHPRLGFILGDKHQHCSQRRLAGFHAAVRDAGLDPARMALMAQGDFSYRSGLDAAEELLSADVRPTAIFASNDDMAAATVAIAHRKGLDVPSDLTVVGFDDAPLATTIWPELTTVRQPITQMAGAAVDLLVRHIRARRADEPLPCEHVLMGYELVRRQSDAAPRSRPPLRLSALG